MTESILTALTHLCGGQVVRILAVQAGASEELVLRAAGPAMAVLADGMACVTEDPEALQFLFRALRYEPPGNFSEGTISVAAAGDTTLPLSQLGQWLLPRILGTDPRAVLDPVAQACGLRPTACAKLIQYLAPVAVGLIGMRVQAQEMEIEMFASLLLRESFRLRSCLPPGVKTIWGGRSLPVSSAVHRIDHSLSWLVILLTAVLAFLFARFFVC